MKLKIYSENGKSSKDKEFNTIPVFEGNKGRQALQQVVIALMAGLRQGNASTKGWSEVRGSGKKPYAQKGTGRARAGAKRSPIWRGGAITHGPKPRDYSQKINQKVKRLAFQRALFERAEEGGLDLIEAFPAAEPKTKAINTVLSEIHPKGTILLVDEAFEDNVLLAARNLERVFMIDAKSLNAWDLVRYDKVLFSERGFDKVIARSQGDAQ
tara:strand:+ start:140330 stop:140965 length:636 start_codon:yes stop_codon:yes gene_type:complete